MRKEKFSTQIEIAASQAAKEKEYWLNIFSGELIKTTFPYDNPGKNPGEHQLKNLTFQLTGDIFSRLVGLSKNSNPRLHMILTACVVGLLHKYTGSKDIIIGIPIDRQEVKGNFVNTALAIRNQVSGNITFKELLLLIKDAINGAIEHQNYPIERLLNDLNLTYSDDFPLFDVVVLLENIQDKSYISHVNPNIYFSFLRTDESIEAKVEYTEVYTKATIERVVTHLCNLLKSAIFDVNLQVDSIDILTGLEKRQLLVDFNDTEEEFPENKTIYEMFAEQVEKTPGETAIVFNREKLTYRALNEKSNQLANLLRGKGVVPDTIVGLMVDISLEMIIGIIGILKAGAAYLPIEPENPGERISYMLEDSETGLLITKSPLSEGVNFSGEIVDIFDPSIFAGDDSNLEKVNHGDHIVYVIYTSGSTGNPKGVLIQHGNITNQMVGLVRKFDFDDSLNHILMAPSTFDPSVQQIFLPLITAGKLYLVPKSTKNDAAELLDFIRANRVNIINTVPSLMNVVVQHIGSGSDLHFKYVILAGEIFPKELYNRLKAAFTIDKIINIYGPTEATINATWYECPREELNRTVPIGKPLMNYKIWILDKQMNLLPLGVAGEICISGKGTAKGYLKRPELTKEKFVESKYAPEGRMYRTGDRGKWLADGNIEFLGRIDNQIKIRGYRVELGEIEVRILSYPDIKEAVVVPMTRESGDIFLAAYIVSDIPVVLPDLQEYLSGKCPDYMVPAYVMQIDRIPLTPNGKLDRQALPAFEIEQENEVVKPRNPIEEKLAKIWAEVLEVEEKKLGIDMEFFDLGGHSLRATLLASRVHREFNVKILLKEIFIHPTIRGISALIKEAQEDIFTAIQPEENRDYYELSINQKRLWFIRQLDPESLSYNIAMRMVFHHEVNESHIRQTLYQLMARHESLRSSFKEIVGGVYQVIEKNIEVPLQMKDISFMEEEEKQFKRRQIFKEATREPLDFTKAPLFKSVLIKWGDRQYDLVINVHHIIADGWSMGVLKDEFYQLYENCRSGKEIQLEALALQYSDFATWSNKQINNPGVKENARQYWLSKMEAGIPMLELPYDFSKKVNNNSGACYRYMVSGEIKDRLVQIARENSTTLFTVMYSLFCIWLSQLTDQEEVACALITAGREHIEVRNVVGQFVNSIMVKTHVVPEESFEDFLTRMNTNLVEAIQHGSYPLELVCKELKIKYPGIPVSFNMLNMRDDTTEMELTPFESYHEEDRADVNFDIEPHILEYKNGIDILWLYKAALFKPSTIELITNIYLDLLRHITQEEDR